MRQRRVVDHTTVDQNAPVDVHRGEDGGNGGAGHDRLDRVSRRQQPVLAGEGGGGRRKPRTRTTGRAGTPSFRASDRHTSASEPIPSTSAPIATHPPFSAP